MGVKATVATVVVLGVTVGGAVVVDRVAHQRTEERLAAEVQDSVPGLGTEPDVTIEGFPFLTQVLAGELDSVRATAPEVTVEDLPLEDVVVHLRGVTTDRPHTADEATMTALVPVEGLGAALDLDVELAVDTAEDALVAQVDVLGLTVDVLLEPSPAGRAVQVDVVALRVGGAEVRPEDLPEAVADQLDGLQVPLDGLPEGTELTRVAVVPDGVEVTAEGADVVLRAPEGSED